MDTSSIERFLERCLKSHARLGLMLFVSGAIYPLGFSPFEIWPLIFISLLPLIWLLTRTSALSAFKIGFYWGLGAFAVGASWVYVSIHEFGFVPVPGALLLTMVFVIFLALYKGLFTYLCHRLLTLSQPALVILIAPMCWVLSEYLQASVFGGFPWLLAGYSQIDSPLASLATWFGVYGISWMVVAIVASLGLLFDQPKRKAAVICLTVLFSLVVLAKVDVESNQRLSYQNQLVDVALVQPNIAQEQKWSRGYFSSIVNILFAESNSLWGADLLVWPEGAIPAYAHQVNDILLDLKKLGVQNRTEVLLGIPQYDFSAKHSYVAFMGVGAQDYDYRKQVLVPFGEYVPLEQWLRGLIKFLDLPMSGFLPGPTDQAPLILEKTTVIPAICYEIVYPEIIRQLSTHSTEDKPQLIVTVSNDAWFGDSFGPYQHLQMARMRALELGLPLARGTNDGITAFVDINGQELKRLPRYQQGSLRMKMNLENRHTRYRNSGAWGLILLCAISGLIVTVSVVRHRNNS